MNNSMRWRCTSIRSSPHPIRTCLTTGGARPGDIQCPGMHCLPPCTRTINSHPYKVFPRRRRTRRDYDILPVLVGTDPASASTTRRGTGFTIRSLRLNASGAGGRWSTTVLSRRWRIGFDAARLSEDSVPTGSKGFGLNRRAVKGHEFGLHVTGIEFHLIPLCAGHRI